MQTTNNLINKTVEAIENANHFQSKLPLEILQLSGMSSPKVRHFLNNIINNQSRYLEIGCWRGSTFISALYQHCPQCAFAIDNWLGFTDPNFQIFCFNPEYGDPYNIFLKNVKKFITFEYKVIKSDCFNIDFNEHKIQNINTYFYDGDHDHISQKMALTHYYDVLDKTFVYIVDDWNDKNAQMGTNEAILELNLKKHFEYIGIARHNGDIKEWWNGFYVSILEKR